LQNPSIIRVEVSKEERVTVGVIIIIIIIVGTVGDEVGTAKVVEMAPTINALNLMVEVGVVLETAVMVEDALATVIRIMDAATIMPSTVIIVGSTVTSGKSVISRVHIVVIPHIELGSARWGINTPMEKQMRPL
jgi:hypothetical protein